MQNVRSWSFDETITNIFDEHVRQSVPSYEMLQSLICGIAQFFIVEDGVVIDIGCSTGETIKQLKEANSKTFTAFGLDTSDSMLKKAEEKLSKIEGVHFLNEEITKVMLPKADVIISCLTNPFISMDERKKHMNAMVNKLKTGGALIIVEKTYAKHAFHQDIFTQLHHDFKEEQGFSTEEIRYKDKSLRGVFRLSDAEGNKRFLENKGMLVEEFFRCLNFVGYVGVKQA
ncbi:methyltransferase domain-containing protein [Bacillus thuringiensis]|uniref:methyltransferase domain-containing protein n=1 Tax=Bacillus thuringiensis TaxID=1428 RepID=UPI0011A5573A|nr:methyltransferase domain-containing protein [Bacillus thuringiensis]